MFPPVNKVPNEIKKWIIKTIITRPTLDADKPSATLDP